MDEKIAKIEVMLKGVKHGDIRWLRLIETRDLPYDKFSVSGELIFDNFGNTKLASHMDGFDIRIDSANRKTAVRGVVCKNGENSSGILKVGVRYRFTASRIIEIQDSFQEDTL
jgi:hypothetical protein